MSDHHHHHHHHHPFTKSVWTWSDDKLFEDALVTIPEGTPHRWHIMASILPGKSPEDIHHHYQMLVEDVDAIVSGRVALPAYGEDDASDDASGQSSGGTGTVSSGRKRELRKEERKRGVPWTEEEHRLFLEGLKMYERGDWRNISRQVVKSKTPTQVASHAQKFFLRQSSNSYRQSKRKSIHDITDPNPRA